MVVFGLLANFWAQNKMFGAIYCGRSFKAFSVLSVTFSAAPEPGAAEKVKPPIFLHVLFEKNFFLNFFYLTTEVRGNVQNCHFYAPLPI